MLGLLLAKRGAGRVVGVSGVRHGEDWTHPAGG